MLSFKKKKIPPKISQIYTFCVIIQLRSCAESAVCTGRVWNGRCWTCLELPIHRDML